MIKITLIMMLSNSIMCLLFCYSVLIQSQLGTTTTQYQPRKWVILGVKVKMKICG